MKDQSGNARIKRPGSALVRLTLVIALAAGIGLLRSSPASRSPTAPPVVEIVAPYIAGMSAWEGGHIWVSTGIAILVSDDDGASWRELPRKESDVSRIDLVSSAAAWIVVDDVLDFTPDGGETWVRAVPPPGIRYLRMDFVNASTGWVAGQDSVAGSATHNQYRLLRTEDSGASWEERALPCRGPDDNPLLSFTDAQTGYLLCPGKVLPDTQMKRLFGTRDSGRTWDLLASTEESPTPAAILPESGWAEGLAALDQAHGWIGMALGPIYATEDGWRTLEPLPSPASDGFPSLVLLARGHGYARGGSGATYIVWETLDGGASWRPVLRTIAPPRSKS
jgi:photosystem II stability/assembly factor-like uncharacterized protein